MAIFLHGLTLTRNKACRENLLVLGDYDQDRVVDLELLVLVVPGGEGHQVVDVDEVVVAERDEHEHLIDMLKK